MSTPTPEKPMDGSQISALEAQVKQGYLIDASEAQALADTCDKPALYAAANSIRKHFSGDQIELCSITNARSGSCSENCKWCSQSAWHRATIEVYPLVERKRVLSEARNSADHGVQRHSLVTSGRRVSADELEPFLELYRDLKRECSIGLCASMGLLGRAELERLKQAGVTRYHCNLETAPSYFSSVCTTHSIEEKIATIREAQAVGLEVCSGGILGLGESMAQRIELALLLRELGITSVPINILNPIAGTPLAGACPLGEEELLTSLALFRFILPKAALRFAGGRILIRSYQDRALKAGINASIVGDLLTTTGSGIAEDLRDFAAAGFVVTPPTATEP